MYFSFRNLIKPCSSLWCGFVIQLNNALKLSALNSRVPKFCLTWQDKFSKITIYSWIFHLVVIIDQTLFAFILSAFKRLWKENMYTGMKNLKQALTEMAHPKSLSKSSLARLDSFIRLELSLISSLPLDLSWSSPKFSRTPLEPSLSLYPRCPKSDMTWLLGFLSEPKINYSLQDDSECRAGRECRHFGGGRSQCDCRVSCPDTWKPVSQTV